MFSFFCTQIVKNQLVTNTLSEARLFTYFYLIAIYDASVLLQYLLKSDPQKTAHGLIEAYGFVFLTAIGLLIIFLANGGTSRTRPTSSTERRIPPQGWDSVTPVTSIRRSSAKKTRY